MSMKQLYRALRGLRSERAAALVEFALVVPLLMLVMCATIDFGIAVFTLNNLTAAVREGGRYGAALSPAPIANDTAVSNRVANYVVRSVNGTLTQAQVVAMVTSTPPDPTTGNITVKITGYPYKPFTPLASLLNLQTILMTRTAIFRYERSS